METTPAARVTVTRRAILIRGLQRVDVLMARLWLGITHPEVARKRQLMERRMRLLRALLGPDR